MKELGCRAPPATVVVLMRSFKDLREQESVSRGLSVRAKLELVGEVGTGQNLKWGSGLIDTGIIRHIFKMDSLKMRF